nr:uncharacterized protein LOC123478353 isoform X2 [Desmodus rotundus]
MEMKGTALPWVLGRGLLTKPPAVPSRKPGRRAPPCTTQTGRAFLPRIQPATEIGPSRCCRPGLQLTSPPAPAAHNESQGTRPHPQQHQPEGASLGVFRAAVHQAGPKALQLTVTQKAWKECNFLVSISYVKPPTASCCSEEVFGAMKVKHNENQTQLPISASIPRFLRASREGPLPRAFRPPTLSLSAFKGLLKQHFLQEGFLLLLYGPQS